MRIWHPLLSSILLLGSYGIAAAATPPKVAPAAFITWKTVTEVPALYSGRVLPNRTSPIVASVFATVDNVATPLTNANIRWYANSALIGSGKNLSTITLPSTFDTQERITLRVIIQDISSTDITDSTIIRRRQPRVTLSLLPGPLRSETLTARAHAFFFSPHATAPLEYRWRVGGEIRSVINDVIVLDTTRANLNQNIHVEATIINPENPLEFGANELTFRVP